MRSVLRSSSRRRGGMLLAAGVCAVVLLAQANDADDYQVQVKVNRQDRQFHATASFHLPLQVCDAYRYLTDYDAAKRVTGVLDSKATRLGSNKVRVERWAQDKVLFFTIKLHSVIEYTELPYKGTEFVQVEGDAKSYQGQWRLEPDGDGTVFRFQSVAEPDSGWPMPVLQYFIQNKMRDRFGEMARNGALRKGQVVPACD